MLAAGGARGGGRADAQRRRAGVLAAGGARGGGRGGARRRRAGARTVGLAAAACEQGQGESVLRFGPWPGRARVARVTKPSAKGFNFFLTKPSTKGFNFFLYKIFCRGLFLLPSAKTPFAEGMLSLRQRIFLFFGFLSQIFF